MFFKKIERILKTHKIKRCHQPVVCAFDVSFYLYYLILREQKMEEEKKKCGLYMRVSTDEQARERLQFARAKGKIRKFLLI